MKMKFKTRAEDLNDALAIASIVQPKSVTQHNEAGYLFVIQGDTCSIHSRDAQRLAKATFRVFDVEGEGAFVYPPSYVDAFKFVGDEISFEIEHEGESHIIRYTTNAGATAERSSCNPALMLACDKEVEAAKDPREYPVAILREALAAAKPFLAKTGDQADDQWKALQIFDTAKPEWEKGNGHLFASNGNQAMYFYSKAFLGKGIAVHGQHLGSLHTFLSKVEGNVTIANGKSMTFIKDNKNRVLGWAHHLKVHGKFSYYALQQDKIVMTVPVLSILNAAKYIRTELAADRDRVKITFDPESSTIQLTVNEGKVKAASPRVIVGVDQDDGGKFSYFINIHHFMDLFSSAKGNQISMRVTLLPVDERRPKGGAAFRTIDEFWLDQNGKLVEGSGVKEELEGAIQCRVTRFMPSLT